MRTAPHEEDADVAKRQRSVAKGIRLVAEASDEDVARIAAARTPDARLVNLVRLLAREAARDFVNAETADHERMRLPD